jgi:hypothetical protein
MPSEAYSATIDRAADWPYCGDAYCDQIQLKVNSYCEQAGLQCADSVVQIINNQICSCYCSCPPPKTCLENILERSPPRPCDPEHCAAKQIEINDFCAIKGDPCNTPVHQTDRQGKCWCCCTCATARTPIEVAGGYRLIEAIEAGDKVLATGGRMAGWEERAVRQIGDLPPGAPRDHFYAARFRFSDDEERFLVVMADQLFLLPSGRLEPVTELRLGGQVVQADGGGATLVSLARHAFNGGVRTVSLGDFDPARHPDDPYRGHLINIFGLVTADLAVQMAYYAGALRGAAGGSGPTEDDHDDR